MEQIKILFFIIGTFFGVDQSRIIADKTTVTIHPEEKTITIIQEHLVTLIRDKNDSLMVKTELEKLIQPDLPWSSEFTDYTTKEKVFYASKDNKSLNSKLTLTYTSTTDLKAFGIDLNKEGKYAMTNFPKSNIKSTDGTLGERYWNFEADKPFTFTLEPLVDLPEEYKAYKRSLLPIWKALKLK